MPLDLRTLGVVLRRRRELRREFDIAQRFREIEESCVPSYCHPNPLAAGVAWWRLLSARALYRAQTGGAPQAGPILDFGAGTGELYHLLDTPTGYHFVEENELLAATLLRGCARARRERLEELATARFGAIFALDSLEHNEDLAALAKVLAGALRPDGLLIACGPTESALYRLGRRTAGFDGHYHKSSVYGVEEALAVELRCVARRALPRGLPLFRVSVWRRS